MMLQKLFRRSAGSTVRIVSLTLLFAAGLMILAGGTANAQSCDDGAGSISGAITLADGRVVPGAAVLAMSADGLMIETASAEDGTYSIASLCDGDYVVFAAIATAAGELAGVYDADGDEEPDVITLDEGSLIAEDIDIVLMREPTGIGGPGTPRDPGPAPEPCEDGTGSISGSVFTLDGTVVEGASVTAVSDRGGYGEAETGADGTYSIDSLCAGEYIVIAYGDDGDVKWAGMYDVDGDEEPDMVTLTDEISSSAENIDITLTDPCETGSGGGGGSGGGDPGRPIGPREPIPAPCEDGVGAITGRVLDADGAAVAGALVVATDEDGWGAESTSRDDGTYAIEGLCSGDYIVFAYVASTAARELIGMYDPDGDGTPDVVSISDDEPSADDIDIRMMRPTAIGPGPSPDPGRPAEPVRPEPCFDGEGTIDGSVINSDGDMVSDAHIIAFDPMTGAAESVTDAAGLFTLDGLCDGEYEVYAGLATDDGFRIGSYDADGDGHPDLATLTEDARALEDIVIELPESEWTIIPLCNRDSPIGSIRLGQERSNVLTDAFCSADPGGPGIPVIGITE